MCTLHRTREQKGQTQVFTFNLADIRPTSVKYLTRKDAALVEGLTQGNHKLIQVQANGKVIGYKEELLMYAEDLEAAKLLKDLLKKEVEACIELMKARLNKERFSKHEDALHFLREEVREVELNEITYSQRLVYDDQKPWLLSFYGTDEKGKSYQYKWNILDIDPTKISFETKREWILVSMGTKQGKNYIRNEVDGELKNYTDKVVLLAPNIEAARIWVNALKALQNMSYNPNSASLTRSGKVGLNSYLTFLEQNIGKIEINRSGYVQQFYRLSPNHTEVLYEVEELSKGKGRKFRFNLADIAPGKVKFATNGKEVHVTLQTYTSENFIQQLEDDLPVGYTDKISIQAQDIEEARRLAKAFKEITQHAREVYIDPFFSAYPAGTFEQAFTFCQQNIEDINLRKNSFGQSLTKDPEKVCLLSFFLEDASKNDAYIFRFHLEDVDPGKLSIHTKGANLYLLLKSRGKKDWMEMTKNGERENFEDKLSIRCQSIEQAKGLLAALSLLTKSCKQ
ncbi:MAG: hypothetical protein AAF696_07370 [Bacteroidota bacterium]